MKRMLGSIKRRLVPPHATDRWQESLLGLRPFERLPIGQAALSITCDDGATRGLEVFDALDEAGARGVMAVSPDLAGSAGHLDFAALRSLRERGHELAFHGNDHRPLTDYGQPAALNAAMADGLARLAAEQLPVPTMIYPCGTNSRWVRQATASAFRGAFTTWYGVNHGTVNRYAIRRVPFGAYAGACPATEAWYLRLIDTAVHERQWLVLMLHPGADEHTREHTALLRRLLRHANDRRLPVRSASAQLEALAPAPAARHESLSADAS